MLRLRIAKGAEEGTHSLGQGTFVLKCLTQPLAFTGRVMCADSYFSGVKAAQAIQSLGLNYIGVVKSATRKFTHGKLSTVVLPYCSDSISCIHKTNNVTN